MPWTARLNSDARIVETTYSGVLTRDDLTSAALETLEVARNSDIWLLLGDCTQLEGGHSITDLYFLAESIATSGLGGRIKEALLLPELPAAAEDVQFWETTCSNRGLRVKVFSQRDLAVKWLVE
jgi:hypothetical protein